MEANLGLMCIGVHFSSLNVECEFTKCELDMFFGTTGYSLCLPGENSNLLFDKWNKWLTDRIFGFESPRQYSADPLDSVVWSKVNFQLT